MVYCFDSAIGSVIAVAREGAHVPQEIMPGSKKPQCGRGSVAAGLSGARTRDSQASSEASAESQATSTPEAPRASDEDDLIGESSLLMAKKG